jgi:4-amino-4-deoxy-L-arabinose transferase-like glycosyltransferase
LVLAAVVFPWYLLIYKSHGWDYIANFFLKDNVARYAGETMGPARGPHFYALAYLADFFPWSVLSLSAGANLWSQRKTLNPERVFSVGFPAVWSGFVLIFFSFSGNKQEYYIAPLYPLMSVLLAGLLWTSVSHQEEHQKTDSNYPWMWSFTAIFLALFALSVFVLLLFRALLPELHRSLHYLPSAVLMIAAFALVWQIIRADLAKCILSVAAPLWLLFLLMSWIFLPAVEPFRPVKEMCEEIDMRSDAADDVGYYMATVPSMVYYLRRPVFEEFDPDAMVNRFQSNKTVFCILTEEDYNYFVGRRDLILYVLDRRARLITQLRYLLDEDSWPARELLLVSNRPTPETGAREGRTTP